MWCTPPLSSTPVVAATIPAPARWPPGACLTGVEKYKQATGCGAASIRGGFGVYHPPPTPLRPRPAATFCQLMRDSPSSRTAYHSHAAQIIHIPCSLRGQFRRGAACLSPHSSTRPAASLLQVCPPHTQCKSAVLTCSPQPHPTRLRIGPAHLAGGAAGAAQAAGGSPAGPVGFETCARHTPIGPSCWRVTHKPAMTLAGCVLRARSGLHDRALSLLLSRPAQASQATLRGCTACRYLPCLTQVDAGWQPGAGPPQRCSASACPLICCMSSAGSRHDAAASAATARVCRTLCARCAVRLLQPGSQPVCGGKTNACKLPPPVGTACRHG